MNHIKTYAYNHSPLTFDFKQTIERFYVEEVPLYPSTGTGNYLILKIKKTEGKNCYSHGEIALRGVGAGLLIAASVFLSQIGGPILGGVAAAFPAVYTSTLLIMRRDKGVEFSRQTAKAMAYSGILTVIPYSVAVHYLYPAVGVWVGTVFSYLLVVPLAVAAYHLIKRP